MMCVSELIEKLQAIEDKSRSVIIAKDAEGNGYSPLSSLWVGAYQAETTWYGDVGFESVDQLPDGYTKEDVIEGGEPAVILCPIN